MSLTLPTDTELENRCPAPRVILQFPAQGEGRPQGASNSVTAENEMLWGNGSAIDRWSRSGHSKGKGAEAGRYLVTEITGEPCGWRTPGLSEGHSGRVREALI